MVFEVVCIVELLYKSSGKNVNGRMFVIIVVDECINLVLIGGEE